MKQFFLILLLAISLSGLSAQPKVSVICPTYDRQERHPDLYRAFDWQTYKNKELLIFDDSAEPSLFFMNLTDPRVKYYYQPNKMTIGSKRNKLVEMAAGEIIAHFDDDDYYGKGYLEEMVGQLKDADLIKLSRWLAWRELDGTLWEWDTEHLGDFLFVVANNSLEVNSISAQNLKKQLQTKEKEWIDKNTWGYGFSYVYRKSLWEVCPFEDINWGEDYGLITKARFLGKKLVHIPDTNYHVLHTLHSKSTSVIFPQYHSPDTLATKLLGNDSKPWLISKINPRMITKEHLETLFSPFWNEDPYLKSFVLSHSFDPYEINYVENRDAYYVEKETSDFIKAGWIKKGHFWEKHIDTQFQKYVKQGTLAIDIGGHIGTHTLSLSRLVGPRGKVHVFEPQAKLFTELVLNMDLNSCQNVIFHRKALGDKKDIIEMNPTNKENEGNTLVGKGGDKVQMEKLDDLQLTNISLIKIDVEGLEEKVIEGAMQTISTQKPVLIIEIWSDEKVLDKIQKIESLGYKAYNLHGCHDYLFLPQ